jgi:mediator of RNA polymerase II transcription subunit 14
MGSNPQNEIVVNLQHSSEIALPNGLHYDGVLEPSLKELEQELPMVYDGQIRLGELLSRVVQQIYAELSELAET